MKEPMRLIGIIVCLFMVKGKKMNRHQRRASKSKKKAHYQGISKKQVLMPDSWR